MSLRLRGSVRAGWLGALAASAVSAAAAEAHAQDDRGIQFLITETSVLNYRVDNRDADPVNDHYGEWLNRLNLQATKGSLTAQLRLDSALYFIKPDPNVLARIDADRNPDIIAQRAQVQGISIDAARSAFVQQRTLSYGRNLSTRYQNTIYPSKMALSYTASGLDVTVGDFYTQLGRGMVLALRKTDELATDTTLRGAKLDYKPDLGGPMRMTMTLLAGYTNPLRVDEVSGRQLSQGRSRFEGAFFPLAPVPNQTFYVPNPEPTFVPDRIIGARFEQGVREVQVSFQGAQLRRGDAEFFDGLNIAPPRNAREMLNGSVGINVPNIADHGSFYGEAAIQSLSDPHVEPGSSVIDQNVLRSQLSRYSGGRAFYGLVTAFQGPVSLTVEGKHYDQFYPMLSSISRDVVEFVALQYNGVPTTEFIWSDTQYNSFNVCVTGGRARLDWRARQGVLFYGSLGHYVTYSERDITCGQQATTDDTGAVVAAGKSSKNRNTVWDPWIGFEWNAHDNRSHAYGSIGSRFDNTDNPEPYAGVEPSTTTYYREYYHVRYDVVRRVTGPWSIQTAGFHRYRFKPEQKPTPWYEGENYLSLLYSPKLTTAFGFEYTTAYGGFKTFFNGQVLYRYTTDKTIRLFVGQSRPALRCVSGVCRQFPAFEGAKLEVVMRF